MEFEKLPGLWQREWGEELVPERVLIDVIQRSDKLGREVRQRDLLESGVALAMVPLFGACIFLGSHPVAQLGAAILTLSCLAIPLRLRGARRHFTAATPDRSLRDFLVAERDRVRAQVRLLRSVLWWYLLPLGIGVVLFFGGGTRSWPLALAYAAVVVVFYAWLYRLNQRAVASELVPRLEQLDGLLVALDERGDAPPPA